MPRRKGTPNTPQKTIDEIVRKHHEGESIKSLARKYNKPFKTIKNMCTRENNKLRNHNIPKQRGRKPAKTLQEYKYEKQEIKDGKRTVAGFSLTHRKEVRTSVKYMVIFRHKEKYSISEMCRFFKVSRSGYYGYV